MRGKDWAAAVAKLFLAAVLTAALTACGGANGKAASSRAVSRASSEQGSAVARTSSGQDSASSRASSESTISGKASEAVRPVSSGISSAENWQAVYPKAFPVLMYHSVSTMKSELESNIYMHIPLSSFQEQMKWLHDNQYHTITLDELYADITAGRPFPSKTVAITFDDGYVDTYVHAFPVLKQYGFQATVFLISGDVGGSAYLRPGQVQEMSRAGVRFECHTVTHPHLKQLSYEKQFDEISRAKSAIEALTGQKVHFLAYPYGEYNDDTLRAVRQAGIEMAFTMSGPWGNPSSILYRFPRKFVGYKQSDFVKLFD